MKKYIKYFRLIVLLIFESYFGSSFLSGQLISLADLPPSINESSGLENSGDSCIWTFNDSGGNPEIYLVDTLGNLLRTLKIRNAWNRDWEDITRDKSGNMYIGNIGNNSNSNTDLCIFKIPDPDTIKSNYTNADLIHFSFEDQYEFPPAKDSLYFDCEALMWYDSHLYLATKNRTKPFDGLSHLYRIPDSPGNYVAEKIASFDTGGENMYEFWITAGDISENGKMLALLTSDKVWLFSDFEEDNFFDGKMQIIQLPHNTHKEGICFSGDKSILNTY